MLLKQYLLKLRNRKNETQNVELLESKNEMNYVNPRNDEEFYDILNNTISNFFPETGSWGHSCFRRPSENLISNLRNNKLLAKKILCDANLAPKYYDKVLEFITYSDVFGQKVHEYEQKIVKWQIDWMRNGGENWICDENLGGDFCLFLPQCDIAFRKGVVDTLVAIGLCRDAIEEGLERNANMWRDLYIEKAFKVRYEPKIINLFETKNFKPLINADLEHKRAWIKMRKYEYYLKHKFAVEKFGVVESDMKLSEEEVEKLKIYLQQKHNERMSQIEQYKNIQNDNVAQPKVRKLTKNPKNNKNLY